MDLVCHLVLGSSYRPEANLLWCLQVASLVLNFLLLYITTTTPSSPSSSYGFVLAQSAPSPDCNQDIVDGSFVLKCGQAKCEPLFDGPIESEWPTRSNKVVQIVSSRAGDRFKILYHQAIDTDQFYYEESHVNVTSFVNSQVKYQSILGFGSTLTDASCITMNQLPDEMRTRLIEDYFGSQDGIRLNLLRVPIGSNEYSIVNYALEAANQVDLSTYDLDCRLAFVEEARQAAGRSRSRLKLLAASGSAPAGLKDNGDLRGGQLKWDTSSLSGYAHYLTGYLSAYRQAGVTVWGLLLTDGSTTSESTANATSDAPQFSAMTASPSQIGELVLAHLGPMLKETGHRVRLFALDNEREFVPNWSDRLFGNVSVRQYLTGIAYRNGGAESRVGAYDNLIYFTRRHPDKLLLASQSRSHLAPPIKLGNWQQAEDYAIEMVKNLEYGSVAWIDFNLALDVWGGPSYANRYPANSAIMVDTQNGTFYRNPMLHAIGHFSRYVAPGSIRLQTKLLCAPNMYQLHQVAFLTPDNYIVQIVVNANQHAVPFRLGLNKRTKLEVLLQEKSLSTFIMNAMP